MANQQIPVHNQPSLLERIAAKVSGPTGALALLGAPFVANIACMATERGNSLLKYTLPSAGVSAVIYLVSCGADIFYRHRSARELR